MISWAPRLGEFDVELGEADVVAGGQADADTVDGDHHRLETRCDRA